MKHDHYQKKALECLTEVSKMRDPGERLKLLAIAQQFILLAAHVGARLDHGNRKLEPGRSDMAAQEDGLWRPDLAHADDPSATNRPNLR